MNLLNKKSKFLILTLLATPLISVAAPGKFLSSYESSCNSSQKADEPINIIPVYVEPKWYSSFHLNNEQNLFNPKITDKVYKAANIRRSTVSSSHLVNILAEGFKKIHKAEQELIRQGKLKPIEYGKTYPEHILRQREKEIEKFQLKKVKPQLNTMYKYYIQALVKREKVNSTSPTKQQYNSLMTLARRQRTSLNNALKEISPSIIQKMGFIKPVTNTDLPMSYRDGYIVKLRFQKPNEKHITIYPRMLVNRLMGEDTYFLNALKAWRDFAKVKYEEIEHVQRGSFTGLFVYIAKSVQGYIGVGESLEEFDKRVELARKAYKTAEADYKHAFWVHDKVHSLSEEETLSLLDMFRSLRNGDIPKCEEAIQNMNKKMASLLKNQSSAKLPPSEKAKADKLGKDVVFYQDIFHAFSLAASKVMYNNYRP